MTDDKKRSYLIDEFEACGVDEYDYEPIIEFIIKDGFDIEGWELYEVPLPDQYCFYNESLNKCFDISTQDGNITAQYMDSKDGEYFNQMFDASSINEAVSKYYWPDVDIIPQD